MKAQREDAPKVPLRSPDVVMRLARLGSAHQCRLSFMRSLMRRMKTENWSFERPVFDIDDKGVGVAVYSAKGPERTYSLVCFAHDLPADQRSDRVIAHAWDSTFTLFDGVPTADDIERLSRNVPKQEAGRVNQSEVSVSRANRSVRLFEHVVSRLAAGQQPDPEQIEAVGYLMRTTAVYGSGKLGAADREAIAGRPECAGPFMAEMLSVYLTRAYTLDLVEHMARSRSPDTAVALDPDLRRRFGVGNSTGLGLAPFIVNHPVLLNNWIAAREMALSRVRSLAHASADETASFRQMLARARINADEWRSEHPIQIEKLSWLRADLARLEEHVDTGALEGLDPWDRLYRWAEETLSVEGQEQLVSLMMEPYGDLVDDLATAMSADEAGAFHIDGAMSLERLREIVEDVYGWALQIDWQSSDSRARVWYTSEEKLEPRLGERFEEPVEPYEQPLAPGRDAARMFGDLTAWTGGNTVAAFLLRHPEHRHVVRRAQITARFPYAEIRDNTISAALLPIDLLRCKLAFFGATHFDPRSDRWVRITMFQDAPFPHELATCDADDWSYPHESEV
ncbi:hypothetical protein [Thalassovita aquimarina]|uniref:Uncharacterized protein n=1 Tax=Thalassovita aquimarina TaxID=2785917 RepID=A0ABS5HN52_9RHOB|nr:hypothetical protein [Thalassovita aquimarina]MBR9650376.1 hypothetical protein [Thalassovita aquimarina]